MLLTFIENHPIITVIILLTIVHGLAGGRIEPSDPDE